MKQAKGHALQRAGWNSGRDGGWQSGQGASSGFGVTMPGACSKGDQSLARCRNFFSLPALTLFSGMVLREPHVGNHTEDVMVAQYQWQSDRWQARYAR
jgi:hypothetical protein